MVTQGRFYSVANVPQIGLYTNVNNLSIVYEIIWVRISNFMQSTNAKSPQSAQKADCGDLIQIENWD